MSIGVGLARRSCCVVNVQPWSRRAAEADKSSTEAVGADRGGPSGVRVRGKPRPHAALGCEVRGGSCEAMVRHHQAHHGEIITGMREAG